MMEWDEIYLDKHDGDDHFPDTWEFFRVKGLATIEVCRVSWPGLEDTPPVP